MALAGVKLQPAPPPPPYSAHTGTTAEADPFAPPPPTGVAGGPGPPPVPAVDVPLVPATANPRVSETMPLIIKFIEGLIEKGHAYAASNGDVYFSVTSDDGKDHFIYEL